MFELFIANKNYSSWSLRPWVLMKTLGIPFEERLVPFPNDAPGSTVFKTVSPSGKVPCLVDGETILWDSLAMPNIWPSGARSVSPADPKARSFARSAAAECIRVFRSFATTAR